MSFTFPYRTLPSDNFTSIDYRYVMGRDNYICQGCSHSIEDGVGEDRKDKAWCPDYYFLKINPETEATSANTALVCGDCWAAAPPLSHLATKKSFTGHLIVITGPMYAEKTTTSESYYDNYGVKYKKRIWVKPDRDDRAKETTTHSGREIKAYTIKANRPDLYAEELKEYDVIVLDESQFFSERIIFLIHKLLKNGCLVIANGLKLTAKRSSFGVMHYLLAEADEIVSLKAVCNICMRINCATRTKSFKPTASSVNTGGVDKYYAVCPACDGEAHEERFFNQEI